MTDFKDGQCCQDDDGLKLIIREECQVHMKLENGLFAIPINEDIELLNNKIAALEQQLEERHQDVNQLRKIANDAVKAEKKAFWWSAEFTQVVHNNMIEFAWADYKSNYKPMQQSPEAS